MRKVEKKVYRNFPFHPFNLGRSDSFPGLLCELSLMDRKVGAGTWKQMEAS